MYLAHAKHELALQQGQRLEGKEQTHSANRKEVGDNVVYTVNISLFFGCGIQAHWQVMQQIQTIFDPNHFLIILT